MRRSLPAAASLALLSVLAPRPASATLLYHDSVQAGGDAAVQLGMCTSECAAVVFTAEEDFDLRYVYLVAGPSGNSVFFDLRVLGVSGNTPDLGNELAYNPFALSIDAAGWAGIDFAYNGMAEVPIAAGQKFAVAICASFLEKFPESCGNWGFATDADGIAAPSENWVYAMTDGICNPSNPSGSCLGTNFIWVQTSLVGVSGDWAIRASDTAWDSGSGTGDDDTSDDDTSDDDDATGGGSLDVDSMSPTSAVEGETPRFEVLGAGFDDTAEVYVGGLRVADVEVPSADRIEGTIPSALPVGLHDLVVTDASGASDTLPRAFEVMPAGSCGCAVGPVAGGLAGGIALLLLAPALRRRHR